jgi:uncharacterized protein (DUF58 family)
VSSEETHEVDEPTTQPVGEVPDSSERLPDEPRDREATEDGFGTEATDGRERTDAATDEGVVERAATPGEETTTPTDRWTIGLTLAMVAGAAGLAAGSPALFLSAVVGVVYTAYGYATRAPSTAVLVERSIGDTSPLPGEDVTVTVTVENVDSRSIPDLRVVDDVPDDLPVVEGTPALATSLKPGDEATFTYVFQARRGTHEFGATTIVSRDVSGATERRKRLDNARSLTCKGRLEALPLDSLTVPFTGRIETDSGGEGLEFHSTRQYSHGDPLGRIDWNRYARTNELTTVRYRETEAATVVVMVDDRERSRVARRAGGPDSLELCRHAGRLIADTLLDANNRVGVAMYGDGTYLTQGGGQAQSVRVHRLLERGPEGLRSEDRHVRMAYGGEHVRTLRRHFPENAQVVFVTPLLDDTPVHIATSMVAHGHAVTVVSPDTTRTTTPGGIVSRIERRDRLRSLREDRVRVVEWSPDEPLQIAVERTVERWSR